MKPSHAIIILCLTAFISSCSRLPSENDARAAVEQKIRDHANGLVRLVSFNKTNATKIDAFAGYSIAYTAEIEFLDDCLWEHKIGFIAKRGHKSELDFGVVEVKKGQNVEIESAIFFQKTEKGWLPKE